MLKRATADAGSFNPYGPEPLPSPELGIAPRVNLTGRIEMGSMADKVTGLTNEAVGKAKQGTGKAVGSDKLWIEGAAQEAKGIAQKTIGDAKAATKDAANKATAFVNKKR
jgi:uncharacterized protein YjbJ (UPF0337 family)